LSEIADEPRRRKIEIDLGQKLAGALAHPSAVDERHAAPLREIRDEEISSIDRFGTGSAPGG
jgi:hypothetical protein